MAESGAWHWNNCGTRLTSPLIAKQDGAEQRDGWGGAENRPAASASFPLLRKRKYESKICCIFFVWAIQRDREEGEEVQGGEKIHKRETNNTHKHACTHVWGGGQGTSLTYEYHMQMAGREQMLLHLIDLYVSCIQTFQCLFWACCEPSSLAAWRRRAFGAAAPSVLNTGTARCPIRRYRI